MENFFDLTNMDADSYDGASFGRLEAFHFSSDQDNQDSHDTIVSSGSRSSSLSANDEPSPFGTPAPESMTFQSGQLQLRWSAETQELIHENTNIQDQHHEKSCPRCKLTPAEARKCKMERRRGQNRESQRKYRARKESRLREAASQVAVLETYVEFLERHNNELEEFNANLQQQIDSFDSGDHPCMIHGAALTIGEVQAKSTGHSGDPIPTPAQETDLGWVPDNRQLSLFYHELLPPHHQSSMNSDPDGLHYAARLSV